VLDEAAAAKGDLLVWRALTAQLVAGAEGPPGAGQDDGANGVVALAAGEGLVELQADLEMIALSFSSRLRVMRAMGPVVRTFTNMGVLAVVIAGVLFNR